MIQIKRIGLVVMLAFIGTVHAMDNSCRSLFEEKYDPTGGKMNKVFVGPLTIAIDKGNIAELAHYVTHDSCANAKDVFGETLLHKAAAYGNVAATQFLLKKGARINVINETGLTPLHEATRRISRQHADVVQLLLNAGAYPLVEDRRGWAPIHFAAGVNAESLRALLRAGALVNVKTDRGFTALDIAESSYKDYGDEKFIEVIDLLRSAGARRAKELK